MPLDGISEPEQSEDETTTSEPADVDSIRPSGSNHVQVYISADKFRIVSLKSLVRKKLAQWTNANRDSPTFVEIVREVVSSVPPHDLGLQDVIAGVI